MPHIHTAPGQHDHTASAYIIRFVQETPYLLLHRHKKFNKLMQPGGHVELNETPWQAVLHEIQEETGYEPQQLKLLQPPSTLAVFEVPNTVIMPMPLLHNSHKVSDSTITDHYHDDIVYAFVATELPTHRLGEGESDELVWATQEDLERMGDDLLAAVRQIADYIFTHCLSTWRQVSLDEFSS